MNTGNTHNESGRLSRIQVRHVKQLPVRPRRCTQIATQPNLRARRRHLMPSNERARPGRRAFASALVANEKKSTISASEPKILHDDRAGADGARLGAGCARRQRDGLYRVKLVALQHHRSGRLGPTRQSWPASPTRTRRSNGRTAKMRGLPRAHRLRDELESRRPLDVRRFAHALRRVRRVAAQLAQRRSSPSSRLCPEWRQ